MLLFDRLEKRLILEAGVDVRRRHAGGHGLLLEVNERLGGEGPFGLVVEQAVDQRRALLPWRSGRA